MEEVPALRLERVDSLDTEELEGFEDLVNIADADVKSAFAYELCIRQYAEHHPVPGTCYFRVDLPREEDDESAECSVQLEPTPNGETLAIGIAFYNEEPEELRRILTSLADEVALTQDLLSAHVLLVGDGFRVMHPGTELYLRYLFCGAAVKFDGTKGVLSAAQIAANTKLDQWSEMMATLKRTSDAGSVSTFIVQPVSHARDQNDVRWRRNEVRVSDFFAKSGGLGERRLKLSLILKADNRRKHNSAEWMLSAFAAQLTGTYHEEKNTWRSRACDYVLLTDAGTLFDRLCLRTMVNYMQRNPQCSGCTGRQRVMTAAEQDCDDENWISVAKLFRIIQCADYEASYAMYTGAFALIGCLPVLPGPCAFIRYSHLVSSVRVRTPVNSTATMHQQLRAAAGVWDEYTQSPLEHFREVVQTSIHDTDLVLSNVKIAEDRIPSYSLITHGPKGAYTTWVEGASFKFQAETQFELWVKQRRRWINGAFASYVWNVFSHPEYIHRSKQPWYRRFLIFMLYFCQLINYSLACLAPAVFGAAFYLALEALDDESHSLDPYIITAASLYSAYTLFFAWIHRYWDFIKPLFYFTALINAGVIATTVASLIREFILKGAVQPSIARMIIMWSAVGVTAAPFILGVISGNFRSVALLLLYAIPYYLFLPTLVGSFSLYSMARLHDVSWGNRQTTDRSGFSTAVSDAELDRLKKDLSSNAGVALLFVSLFNIVLEFCVIFFRYDDWFVVGIIGSLFITTMIQAIMSCIFFIGKHLSLATCRQIKAGRSCKDICQGCCHPRRVGYEEV